MCLLCMLVNITADTRYSKMLILLFVLSVCKDTIKNRIVFYLFLWLVFAIVLIIIILIKKCDNRNVTQNN